VAGVIDAVGDLASVQGSVVEVRFETGLTLAEGDCVLLSPTDLGGATNVASTTPTHVQAPIGAVLDVGTYDGVTLLKASIILKIEVPTLIV
jgi:hypothetical protein